MKISNDIEYGEQENTNTESLWNDFIEGSLSDVPIEEEEIKCTICQESIFDTTNRKRSYCKGFQFIFVEISLMI